MNACNAASNNERNLTFLLVNLMDNSYVQLNSIASLVFKMVLHVYIYIHSTHIADFVTASVAGLDLACKGTSVAVILRGNKHYFYYLLCLQASKDVSATLNQPLQKWKISLYVYPHSPVEN